LIHRSLRCENRRVIVQIRREEKRTPRNYRLQLPGTRDLDQLAAVKACTDHAIATAVDTIKRPALTRIYDEKFGITQSVTVVASR
jgi:hypothetical protein